MLERALSLRLRAIVLSVTDAFNFASMEASISQLVRAEVPIIAVGQNLEAFGISSVTFDEFSAGTDAVRHLFERNCRRIAYLNRISESAVGRNRYEGYLSGLEKASLPVREDLVWFPPSFRFEGGYQAVKQVLSSGVEFDAILAGTDELAIGAISMLSEARLNIPEQVKVIGFGGLQVGQYSVPALTSLTSDAGQVAAKVSEMMSHKGVSTISLRRNLVVRRST